MTHAPIRREKVFGTGRPRPMDREAKVRIMTLARALSRRTEARKHYGALTAKALAVLEALLWQFHNARTGICFPSLKAIAEAAGCARSTAQKAVEALEAAGLLSWVNRLKRVAEHGPTGWIVRVVRTSNGYRFRDPRSSNTENRSRTTHQDYPTVRQKPPEPLLPGLEAALARLGAKLGANFHA